MTGAPPPVYRLPAAGPNPATAQNIADWDVLVADSIDRATATAEKWRAGLAAFVTIVTSVLLLKGPDAQKLEFPWNIVVIGPLGLGAALLILGLWRALQASAPGLTSADFTAVTSIYGTVRAYSIAVANDIGDRLHKAKFWVLWALLMFGAGIIAWWLVPTASAKVTPLISVTDQRGLTVTCGTFVESKNGGVTLRPQGGDVTVTIPLRDVSALAVAQACSTATP